MSPITPLLSFYIYYPLHFERANPLTYLTVGPALPSKITFQKIHITVYIYAYK